MELLPSAKPTNASSTSRYLNLCKQILGLCGAVGEPAGQLKAAFGLQLGPGMIVSEYGSTGYVKYGGHHGLNGHHALYGHHVLDMLMF